jgi:hypothetical protein
MLTTGCTWSDTCGLKSVCNLVAFALAFIFSFEGRIMLTGNVLMDNGHSGYLCITALPDVILDLVVRGQLAHTESWAWVLQRSSLQILFKWCDLMSLWTIVRTATSPLPQHTFRTANNSQLPIIHRLHRSTALSVPHGKPTTRARGGASRSRDSKSYRHVGGHLWW